MIADSAIHRGSSGNERMISMIALDDVVGQAAVITGDAADRRCPRVKLMMMPMRPMVSEMRAP